VGYGSARVRKFVFSWEVRFKELILHFSWRRYFFLRNLQSASVESALLLVVGLERI